MNRPRQHVIETESKKQLANIIPSNWVIRELTPDYGLDFMVEIFKSQNASGYIFYIQLKGSDQTIKNNSFQYQLQANHIDYYHSIPSPVLLVMYSTENKQFWGQWSNSLKDILVDENSIQKTYKIVLDEKNLIDENFFKNLEKDFSNNIHKKVNIIFHANNDKAKLFHGLTTKWINHYYKREINHNDNALPNFIKFQYKLEKNLLNVTLNTPDTTLKLKPFKIISDNILHNPFIDIDNPPSELQEILLATAFLLRKHNIENSLKLIINNIANYNGDIISPIFLMEIIKEAIETNSIVEIKKISEISISINNVDYLQFINAAILIFDSKGILRDLYQQNLLTAIDKFNDFAPTGSLCYNLANSYRGTNQLYLSSKYYQLARKRSKNYLDKSYWWFEYAGVLYLSGHYLTSEKFYKKSISLDKERNIPIIYFLIGDCLFFQGKFKDAKREYEKFLDTEPINFIDEATLKIMVCENFIILNLDSVKFDIKQSFALTEQFIQNQDESHLRKAIDCFPLNGLAWFNLGTFAEENGFTDEAINSFIITSFIQEWDKEAWKNSFLISFFAGSINLAIPVFYVILDKFGIEGASYISEYILNHSILEERHELKIIEVISVLTLEYESKIKENHFE